MSDTGGTNESLADIKKRMLHDAQNSIAQLLYEIKQHRFLHYPMEKRTVKKNTEKKGQERRRIHFATCPGMNQLRSRGGR
jgi:hypothetical protein